MMIRLLTTAQIGEALELANSVFDRDLAPFVSAESAQAFHSFAGRNVIIPMMQAGKLHVWGAFDDDGNMLAVSSMNDPYHVSLLFVESAHRGQGIGLKLLDTMAAFGAVPGSPHPLTVNAMIPAVDYFKKAGFVNSRDSITMNNVSCQPMQRGLSAPTPHAGAQSTLAASSNNGRKNKVPGPMKALIIGICILSLGIFVFAFYTIAQKTLDMGLTQEDSADLIDRFEDYYSGNGDSDDGDEANDGESEKKGDDTEDTSEKSGISEIPAYEQKDLSYEIKDSAFSEQEQESKYNIYLSVRYPQLEGLEGDEDKINETIKEFALETEKAIYETPNQEQTEKVLELDSVYVYNQVEYKVSYASDDFISIVFNDASLLGSSEDKQILKIRTLNLDLKTGKDYKIPEVFNIEDKEFLRLWEKSITAEAGENFNDSLPEFSDKQDIALLSGKNEDYPPAFFVDKNGVEIGFSILDEDSDSGWVTGPISKKEIAQYLKSSDFSKRVTWK